MRNLSTLKQRKPDIAIFLEKWANSYERRKFDLAQEKEAFIDAINELANHISLTSQNATITTIVGDDGLKTVYLSVS